MKRGLKVGLNSPFNRPANPVTTYSPMKRGLKVRTRIVIVEVELVTTYSPMKRGLKARPRNRRACRGCCYNLFPDEKGTESSQRIRPVDARQAVTTYSPMKRGLKDAVLIDSLRVLGVTTYSPMKRGLKARPRNRRACRGCCYNLFPDEKGTES